MPPLGECLVLHAIGAINNAHIANGDTFKAQDHKYRTDNSADYSAHNRKYFLHVFLLFSENEKPKE